MAGIIHTTQTAQPDSADGKISANAWNQAHTISAEFNVPIVAAPATPAAGSNVAADSVGGRSMLGQLDANGLRYPFQPFLGRSRMRMWCPGGGGLTTLGYNDGSAPSTFGTATGRAQASTNLCTSAVRLGYVSAAAVNSAAGLVAGANTIWRGNAAGLGGFFVVWRFAISDAALNANGQTFVGVADRNADPQAGNPSTFVNAVGVGTDSGDVTLQLYAAGAAAQPRVNLGANFPANTLSTDVYELVLWAPPNGASIQYLLTRLNTGNTASGTINVAANLPVNTTFMSPRASRATGATATAVGIDILGMYLETGV